MSIYPRPSCVYLTIYGGNKLPPFYIGSVYLNRLSKGYTGSVESKRYKATYRHEKKTNPQLFTVKIIKIFNDRQQAANYEATLHKQLNVANNPLYFNMHNARSNDYGPRTPPTQEHKDRQSAIMLAYYEAHPEERTRLSLIKTQFYIDNPEMVELARTNSTGRQLSLESKTKIAIAQQTHQDSFPKYKLFTPNGVFFKAKDAAKANNLVAASSVIRRCGVNNNTLVTGGNSKTPKEYIGKTWRELGWGRELINYRK